MVAAAESHAALRAMFDLPRQPPRIRSGLGCAICVRGCRLGEGDRGYCGIRINRNGKLRGGDTTGARVQFYHDPLPTNCVAEWVCPATGNHYPKFSYRPGVEHGYRNLAVFYQACSFDCLFCQNWHYRRASRPGPGLSAQQLAEAVDERTACICFFGGDPGPQIDHALASARLALERSKGRILRICWETNGAVSPHKLDEMLDLSLESGGCIKFDLKAFDSNLHEALCGVGNERTLANFRRAATRVPKRPEPPLVVASTLLVPGYIDVEEVRAISRFIAQIDPNIPYSLLGFHPDFAMTDLPCTSLAHALAAQSAAESAGLRRVKIGNRHLLGNDY